MKKKSILIIVTIALVLGVIGSIVFAKNNYESQAGNDTKKEQDDLADVREYCEMYGIEMSESPEFVREVREMIDERGLSLGQ